MSVSGDATANAALLAAYRKDQVGRLARSLIVLNLISLVVVPGGFVLDYFLYPERFGEFLAVRLGADFVLVGLIGLIYLARKKGSLAGIKTLGVLSALAIIFAMTFMIYRTNGAASPYHAGLTLVLTCWAIISPWSVVETAVMCVVSLAGYVLACIVNPGFREVGGYEMLGFGSFFLLITTAVCIGVTVYLSRTRFEEFCLRHQLDEKNRELQDLDRVKTQFFSNVSHELRTPLTLILGPADELLRRGGELEPAVHDSMILIQRNTLRLLKLINDLLDLTRMDQGVDVLRRKPVAVDEFLRGVVESVRHLGLTKRMRMKIEADRTNAVASLDPARVEKVLLNLLTNAIKYTPAGGTITVRWGAADEKIWFEVADNGVGIPPEDLSRVFERFHQVRSNAANQNQGVGIGLSLARELVEQHGGTLSVESEMGVGTTFRAELPEREPKGGLGDGAVVELESVERGEVAALEDVEEPFEKAFRSADRSWTYDDSADGELPEVGSGARLVLVADDEHDMRRYVVGLLSEDYRIVQTQHGGNVVELVATHRPDLVLLDWMMPGKDGLTLCRELRADPENSDLKIVLLTARADEESKIDALQAGADDFLTKPFSSIEVRTRVRNLVRSGEMQCELRASNRELTGTLQRLRETETVLIQSEKMNAIGSLSAGLLHEINNPLNYTMTAISIAKQCRDTLSEDMQEIVADVEEGMIRIRDVVTDLKTFAYPEKAGVVSAVALEEVVRSARKIVAGELEGVEVEVDLPEGVTVRGQKTPLIHVFINLLNNANRAMRESGMSSGLRVVIRGKVIDERMEIIVQDNGPGIPEDIIGRVFEAFFTTRKVGTGMGMGLSICNTILESQSGSIRVDNGPEGGAVFTIYLPLAEPALIPC